MRAQAIIAVANLGRDRQHYLDDLGGLSAQMNHAALLVAQRGDATRALILHRAGERIQQWRDSLTKLWFARPAGLPELPETRFPNDLALLLWRIDAKCRELATQSDQYKYRAFGDELSGWHTTAAETHRALFVEPASQPEEPKTAEVSP